MRLLAAVLAAVAVAPVVGGCGKDARDRVSGYIESANAIQERAAPEFRRANQAYARFTQQRLAPDAATRELTRAEESIRATRTRLAELRPPREARRLHQRLLVVFDANAAFAHESTLLARYLPAASAAVAPLPEINGRLQRGLDRAREPDAQTAALRRYGAGLSRLIGRMGGLRPPPILMPTHREQVRRLLTARELSRRLRDAIHDQDARRLAGLLRSFRALTARRPARDVLTDRAIRAYNRRYRAVGATVRSMQRERLRLERSLD